jgi:hypothetical protein
VAAVILSLLAEEVLRLMLPASKRRRLLTTETFSNKTWRDHIRKHAEQPEFDTSLLHSLAARVRAVDDRPLQPRDLVSSGITLLSD